MAVQLTIGQVAERTGVATSALRYWEALGLIIVGPHVRQPAALRACR